MKKDIVKGEIMVRNYYLNYFSLTLEKSIDENQTSDITLENYLGDRLGCDVNLYQNPQRKINLFCDLKRDNLKVNKEFKQKKGKLWIEIRTKANRKLRIIMHFQIDKDCNNCTLLSKLCSFIQKCISTNKEYQYFDYSNNLLHNFLKPHISGAKEELRKFASGIQVSFIRNKEFIEIKGDRKHQLLHFAQKTQFFTGEDVPELFIQFQNGQKNIISWNSQKKSWILKNSLENTPTNGYLWVSYEKEGKSNNFLSHPQRVADKKIVTLNLLKNSNSIPGGNIFREYITNINFNNRDKKHFQDIGPFSEFEQFLEQLNLKDYLSYLDPQQKKVLWKVLTSKINILEGLAGTGKTEVGTIIVLIYIMLNKRVLIATETNEAIDNFLLRVHNHIQKIGNQNDSFNIVRFESYHHEFSDPELCKYSINAIIPNLQAKSSQKSEKKENQRILKVKSKFKEYLSIKKNINEFISFSYDSITSTLGTIGQRKFFNENHHPFDLFIIDGSNLINLAMWSMGAIISKKWLIIGDKNQLSHVLPTSYLPKIPIRNTTTTEKLKAEIFNPNSLYVPKNYSFLPHTYKDNIISLLNQLERRRNKFVNNTYIRSDSTIFHVLMTQYRMERNLNESIGYIFNKTSPYSQKYNAAEFISLDLNSFNIPTHQRKSRFYLFETNSRKLKHLTQTLIDKCISISNSKRKLNIGITCMNISFLKELIKEDDNKKSKKILPDDQEILIQKPLKKIRNKHFDLTFSSITNHEEKQYDIILIVLSRGQFSKKSFNKRLYTAVSRAKSYVFLVSPIIPFQKQSFNKIIIEKLKEFKVN